MHESNDLTLILNIKILNIKSLTLHIQKKKNNNNKSNIKIEKKNVEKIEGICTKSLVQELLINPGC